VISVSAYVPYSSGWPIFTRKHSVADSAGTATRHAAQGLSAGSDWIGRKRVVDGCEKSEH
jgi:hypothetical protein